MDFPNLLSHDTNQIAMLTTAFAFQTEFFQRFSGVTGVGFLTYLAFIFGLIGFCVLVLFREAWTLPVVISWCILFLIVIVGYYGERLFFTSVPLESRMFQTRTDLTGTYTPYEIAEGRVPASIQEAIQASPRIADVIRQSTSALELPMNQRVMMFTPQAAAIHISNIMQQELAQELFRRGQRSLTGRMGATEALRVNSQLKDYRAIFDIGAFRAACQAKVQPQALQPVLTEDQLKRGLSDMGSGARNNSIGGYAASLLQSKLKLEDAFNIHMLFWQQYENRPQAFQQNFPIVPPLVLLEDRAAQDLFNSGRLQPAELVILRHFAGFRINMNGRPPRPSIGTLGSFNAVKQAKWAPYQQTPDTVRQNFLREVLPAWSNASEAFKNMPVDLVVGYVDDSGNIADAPSAFERFLRGLSPVWGIADLIFGNPSNRNGNSQLRTCLDMQIYTAAAVNKSIERQLQLDRPVADMLRTAERGINQRGEVNFEGQTYTSLAQMDQDTAMRYAYQAMLASRRDECAATSAPSSMGPSTMDGFEGSFVGGGQGGNCNTEEIALGIRNAMAVSAANNASPYVQELLQEAMGPAFSGGIRQLAAEVGSAITGPALFFKSMFGGFAAGTYSGIAPYIIAWALGLTIMLTPFLYVIGLMIPMWAPQLLLFPILAVLYFKMVEISFILINGIFRFFHQATLAGFSIGDGTMEHMADILLGSAYTAAFAIALFLLFGLKNPFGALQQVAGAADKTAQISAQEAMAMVGATLGAVKFAANLLPGASKLVGTAAGMLQNAAESGASGGEGGGSGFSWANAGKAVVEPFKDRMQASFAEGAMGAKKDYAARKVAIAGYEQTRKMERGELDVQRDPATGVGVPRTMTKHLVEVELARINKIAVSQDETEMSALKKDYLKGRLETVASDRNLDQHVGKDVVYQQDPTTGENRRMEVKRGISAVASDVGKAIIRGETPIKAPRDSRTGGVSQLKVDGISTEIVIEATAKGYFSGWDGTPANKITPDMKKQVVDTILADLASGGLKTKN